MKSDWSHSPWFKSNTSIVNLFEETNESAFDYEGMSELMSDRLYCHEKPKLLISRFPQQALGLLQSYLESRWNRQGVCGKVSKKLSKTAFPNPHPICCHLFAGIFFKAEALKIRCRVARGKLIWTQRFIELFIIFHGLIIQLPIFTRGSLMLSASPSLEISHLWDNNCFRN